MTHRWACCLGLLLIVAPAQAQLDQIRERLGQGSTTVLSEPQVVSGLKEALQLSADNAVSLTGRTDGFFGNAAIRILMPKKLRSLEKGLRAVGYGDEVDGFILSMNRAAEAAAPAAKQIFREAILSMSFDDARQILSGGDTAATDYFRRKSSDQLAAAFAPHVEATMNQNGVTQRYEALTDRYQGIPFGRSKDLDINGYVVRKTLDGLFHQLAEQEQQIRRNPGARTTDLLREVFGR